MRSKKSILIGIILIIFIAFVVIFVLTTRKDKLETERNMENIKKNYNLLTTSVNYYNEIRTKYATMSSVLLMDKYEESHEEYTKLLTDYNKVMKDIDTYITNISFRCNNKYSDTEINKVCDNYKELYEKLVNLYVNDLNNYNKFIDKYNDYKNTELEKFEMIHNDYIDYNNDNVYEGREEREES